MGLVGQIPMTPNEIRIELLKRNLSITGLAKKFSDTGTPCRRQELSMMIRGVRVYPVLRKRLAKELGISVNRLFCRCTRQAA